MMRVKHARIEAAAAEAERARIRAVREAAQMAMEVLMRLQLHDLPEHRGDVDAAYEGLRAVLAAIDAPGAEADTPDYYPEDRQALATLRGCVMFPYATIGEIIRNRLEDADGLLIHEVYDEGGFGVVRYSRLARGGREHIVHRWALVDTASQAIPGGLLWMGLYTMDEDEAKADFVKRSTGGNS